MPRMILTPQTIGELASVNTRVELVDENGKFLGYFSPVEPALLEPTVSEEELQRREKSDKWYTTAEVLAHLEKLQ